jgi:pseudouridine-5'-phosphate glycosidase
MNIVNRAGPDFVALETTLLVHGVPRDRSATLAAELGAIVEAEGSRPAVIGIHAGRAVAGLTAAELTDLLNGRTEKANTPNLGVFLHRKQHAATTVSATMEIAAAAGIRLFATGGLGGVHPGLGHALDISADLAAVTRFPVAVVASGVKSLLDVESTREALETLGIPVIGFACDRFPAFYLRESGRAVDGRFDDVADLAPYLAQELERTPRGVVVCNPIPPEHQVSPREWEAWLAEAQRRTAGALGRDATPALLAALHEVSAGRTLEANLALVRSNTRLAARLCRAMLDL